MSEAKFTKGEWVTALRNDDELQTTFFGIVFGGVFLQIGSGNESRVNAHLIAAAPEMYNLLEKLVNPDNCKKDIIHIIGNAESLLAKARGEHE